MIQLARYYGSDHLAHIEELAEAENVPQNYLVQILNELRNGGLINSKRGKRGGYMLARDPETVTLRDVIAVMDPEMLNSRLSEQGQSGRALAAVWDEVSNSLKSSVSKHSLRELMPAASDVYYI